MRFDELDAQMRVYETAHDVRVPPDVYMVARLDGRNFTRLTKEVRAFDRPYDARFRDLMIATTEHVMQCGFHVAYGYTQSDEISLLFPMNEAAFGRKTRKYDSVLAGEASAAFSLMIGEIGCFDGRISQLPSRELVVDYFRWRGEDAYRNCLNAYCYWTLRGEGRGARPAAAHLKGMPAVAKRELLRERGIIFDDLPAWQRNGTGLYWETYEKQTADPRTGEAATATRRRIVTDGELPSGDVYGSFVRRILDDTSPPPP